MEFNGELFALTPEERIRAAAIGHLLDAEYGLWGGGREQLRSRSVNFFLDVVPREEDNDLNIVNIKSSDGSLYVGITQFREDLAATLPMDTYVPTRHTFIKFPDPFDPAATEGDTLTQSELHEIAIVLEHDHLEELDFDHGYDTLDRTLALLEANNASYHIFTDRLIAHYRATEGQDDSAYTSRVKRIAAGLRRMIRL